MSKVMMSNHSAVRVPRAARERIRSFYCGVLGAALVRELADKDDIRIGDDFFIAFLYAGGDGRAVDQGVVHGAPEALGEDDFLKGVFLELKTEDVEGVRQKIVASGVKVLAVPDPHLYFQAPGGQVWRLVGVGEDLSLYEGTRG